MKWHEVTENPNAVTCLYADVPNLENVDLFALELHRDGAKLVVRINLPRFPDFPPIRWPETYNTAQMELAFFGVNNVRIVGWNSSMKVNVRLTKVGDNSVAVLISDDDETALVSLRSEIVRINKILAYEIDHVGTQATGPKD